MGTANQLLSQIHDIKSHQKQAARPGQQQRQQTRPQQGGQRPQPPQSMIDPIQTDFDRMGLGDPGRNSAGIGAGGRISLDRPTPQGAAPPYTDQRDPRSSPHSMLPPLPPTPKLSNARVNPDIQPSYPSQPPRSSYDQPPPEPSNIPIGLVSLHFLCNLIHC